MLLVTSLIAFILLIKPSNCDELDEIFSMRNLQGSKIIFLEGEDGAQSGHRKANSHRMAVIDLRQNRNHTSQRSGLPDWAQSLDYCDLIGDPMMIESYLSSNDSQSFIRYVEPHIMSRLMDTCDRINRENYQSIWSKFKIYPGTKWCGPGNIAANFDDLGVRKDTDRCCRQHDNCSPYIESGKTFENLHNDGYMTRMHCDCDNAFASCLSKASDEISDNIGYFFFDLYGNQCFKKEHPKIKCLAYRGPFNRFCLKYQLDYKGQKNNQWFDPKPYKPSTSSYQSRKQLCFPLNDMQIYDSDMNK